MVEQPNELSDWTSQFGIQSITDLDFVIGQELGWRIGMTRSSPPEFRRRVLAAAISYHTGLGSVDYTLKRYVNQSVYESIPITLGDRASDALRDSSKIMIDELNKLHAVNDLCFGRFGAEITLFKFPYVLDSARILANRGLLLEVLTILRLSVEMFSWAAAVFDIENEAEVIGMGARSCISKIKPIYKSVGRVYGYLSRFSHWEHSVHSEFLAARGTQAAVIVASAKNRAISLTVCFIVLDIFVEVIRRIYGYKSDALIMHVQGVPDRVDSRKTHQLVAEIMELSGLAEVRELASLLR